MLPDGRAGQSINQNQSSKSKSINQTQSKSVVKLKINQSKSIGPQLCWGHEEDWRGDGAAPHHCHRKRVFYASLSHDA
jgi:hypothetical protein